MRSAYEIEKWVNDMKVRYDIRTMDQFLGIKEGIVPNQISF